MSLMAILTKEEGMCGTQQVLNYAEISVRSYIPFSRIEK